MKLLIASTNLRAGKTSVICGLSKIRDFGYEKLGRIKGAEEIIASKFSDPRNDFVVIEGGETYKHGISEGKGDFHHDFDKALLVTSYDELCFDELYIAGKIFADRFAAAIVNSVPEERIDEVREEASKHPLEVIGVVPYEASLSGTKISSIAKLLDGVTLTSLPQDMKVDKILVGAMSPSCAVKWLEKSENSALITGGDRVDLQKLALDRGVKCLILTGGFEPPKVIVKRAEESGSVIILSEHDTLTSLEKIQKEIGKEALDEAGMEKAAEIVNKNVDFNRLFEILGI